MADYTTFLVALGVEFANKSEFGSIIVLKMEGWLIFFAVILGIGFINWVTEQLKEQRERERSKQRDEIAVNVIAEYNLTDQDKKALDQRFEYVRNSLPNRLAEQEPYEIISPPRPQRRQGMLCPKCQMGYLVRRQGKYGYFLGCTRYPLCNSTKPTTWKDKRAKEVQKNRYAKEFLDDLKKAYS